MRPPLPLLIAAVLLLTAACRDDEAPPPAEDRDAPDATRVISLSPSTTGIIEGLGRADRLVGVTKWCDVEGVPVVGDMRPDVEKVLAADPTLVVAGAYPSLTNALEGLEARGLEVLALPLDSLDDTRRAVEGLGRRLDATERADAQMTRLDRALAEAKERAEGFEEAPRVLLVFDVADGYVFTTGGGDHTAEVLAAVGAENVADGGPLTSRLPLERVLKLAPQVIVHTAPTERFPDDDAARAYWSSMGSLPAVKAGQIHVWPNGDLATHGPGLADAIERLSKLLAAAAAERTADR